MFYLRKSILPQKTRMIVAASPLSIKPNRMRLQAYASRHGKGAPPTIPKFALPWLQFHVRIPHLASPKPLPQFSYWSIRFPNAGNALSIPFIGPVLQRPGRASPKYYEKVVLKRTINWALIKLIRNRVDVAIAKEKLCFQRYYERVSDNRQKVMPWQFITIKPQQISNKNPTNSSKIRIL